MTPAAGPSVPPDQAPGPSWRPLALAALGGVALFLSDAPVGGWPLQLVAFVPLLLAARGARCRWHGALIGAVFALSFGLPLVGLLAFPWWATLLQLTYVMVLWGLVGVGLTCVAGWREPWRALGSAAVVVLIGWLDVSAWPQWGSAQLFTRVWSAAPWAVQFVSATGPLGPPFVVLALQGLGLALLGEPIRRAAVAAALLVLLVPVVTASLLAGAEAPRGSLRVAAIGFPSESIDARAPADTESLFASTLDPLLAEAVKGGARLVLFPEVSVALAAADRERVLARLGRMARDHGVVIGLGYGDLERDQNRLAIVGRDGRVLAEYAKTHLIWGVEDWQPGTTGPVRFEVDGWRVGVMICQDDNFADLVRDHARAATDLVLVPTWDWAEVAPFHRENSLLRPIEARYGLVRAAKNGSSLLADSRGRVLAERDHLTEGAGVVLADLPLYRGGSFYGTAGDWIALASAGLLALGTLLHRRRGGRPDPSL